METEWSQTENICVAARCSLHFSIIVVIVSFCLMNFAATRLPHTHIPFQSRTQYLAMSARTSASDGGSASECERLAAAERNVRTKKANKYFESEQTELTAKANSKLKPKFKPFSSLSMPVCACEREWEYCIVFCVGCVSVWVCVRGNVAVACMWIFYDCEIISTENEICVYSVRYNGIAHHRCGRLYTKYALYAPRTDCETCYIFSPLIYLLST